MHEEKIILQPGGCSKKIKRNWALKLQRRI